MISQTSVLIHDTNKMTPKYSAGNILGKYFLQKKGNVHIYSKFKPALLTRRLQILNDALMC